MLTFREITSSVKVVFTITFVDVMIYIPAHKYKIICIISIYKYNVYVLVHESKKISCFSYFRHTKFQFKVF